MHSTVGLALSSLLTCAFTLTPEAAKACSPLPAFEARLEAVGVANAAGPLVFYLECRGESPTSTCRDVIPPLRVNHADGNMAEVAGTVSVLRELGNDRRLLAFTPVAPLGANLPYSAVVVGGSEWGDYPMPFSLASPDGSSPLAHVIPTESQSEAGAGMPYECSLDANNDLGGSCEGASGRLTWSSHKTRISRMGATLSGRDGWLFYVSSEPALPAIERLVAPQYTGEREFLEEGASCLTLYALNVYDETVMTREVCMTGAANMETWANYPVLRNCAEPPTASGKAAPELLEGWCADRRRPCKTIDNHDAGVSRSSDYDCASYAELCPLVDDSEPSETEDSRPEPAGPTDSSDDEPRVVMKSHGCSVHVNGSPDAWSGVFGFATIAASLVGRTRARRRRRA